MTLRWLSGLLLAALAVAGCSHHPRKVEPWVWPGANRFNTLSFAQAGTRPSPVLRYVVTDRLSLYSTEAD